MQGVAGVFAIDVAEVAALAALEVEVAVGRGEAVDEMLGAVLHPAVETAVAGHPGAVVAAEYAHATLPGAHRGDAVGMIGEALIDAGVGGAGLGAVEERLAGVVAGGLAAVVRLAADAGIRRR